MKNLNFPEYPLRYKIEEDQKWIFDIIRRKYLVAGPEEIVRQHLVHFFIEELAYPKGKISVEKQLMLNGMKRRTDVVIYDKETKPLLIAECKAPQVKITQDAFEQVARYNLKLRVEYLVVTNGLSHYCCKLDLKKGQFVFLKDIPTYSSITS